ncbi:hypothetical protein C8F04DRAFT_557463 [Mycena alexandri]|uniref:Uncharacterized protein n=1 Tax=Mycena alexandri TaxID=1745969 RepID=A0AAD6RVW5_9AGAR|nr:hypothetical protein C8F04DRAFT_557463 [Mycena alexandri]
MDSSATHNDNDDVDAEGEVVGDANAPMTLVDAGGLASALGLPSPAPGSGIGNGGSALAGGGVGKRYRPAPAKTFQCRGYGECRMVFSRSEHLARHVSHGPFSSHPAFIIHYPIYPSYPRFRRDATR